MREIAATGGVLKMHDGDNNSKTTEEEKIVVFMDLRRSTQVEHITWRGKPRISKRLHFVRLPTRRLGLIYQNCTILATLTEEGSMVVAIVLVVTA